MVQHYQTGSSDRVQDCRTAGVVNHSIRSTQGTVAPPFTGHCTVPPCGCAVKNPSTPHNTAHNLHYTYGDKFHVPLKATVEAIMPTLVFPLPSRSCGETSAMHSSPPLPTIESSDASSNASNSLAGNEDKQHVARALFDLPADEASNPPTCRVASVLLPCPLSC